MLIKFLLLLATLSSLNLMGAEGVGTAENRPARLEDHLKRTFRKDAPDIEFNLITRRKGLELPFQEKVPGSNEPVNKVTVVDMSNYQAVLHGSETNMIAIYDYASRDEASTWMEKLIRRVPVQPPLVISDLGEEGVRFPGVTPDRTGSMFFRRGTILVQVNAKKSDVAELLGRLIDKALKRALEE